MSDRKVRLKIVMSLDGFVTSPDGTHEWMFEWFGDDLGGWNHRALEEAGVHAMGRRSYEIIGRLGRVRGADRNRNEREAEGCLLPHSEKAEWGPAEIFGGDLRAEVADLKARDDEGTVLVHGGPDFAKSMTRLGLVDEYQLTTVPIAIGAGPALRRARRAPEAGRRRRGALPERSPRADPGAEAMSDGTA